MCAINQSFVDILLKIKRLLDSEKKTITEVAKELRVNRGTIYSWGNATYPKVDQLVKLAQVYDVPITYFFEEENQHSQSIHGNGNVAAVNSHVTVPSDNKELEISHLKALVEEKEKRIQDKDRMIELLSSQLKK